MLIIKMATFEDFQKLDVRVGKIVEVEELPEAKKPSYKLKIDFGTEIGIKKSCAQLVKNYSKEDLMQIFHLVFDWWLGSNQFASRIFAFSEIRPSER